VSLRRPLSSLARVRLHATLGASAAGLAHGSLIVRSLRRSLSSLARVRLRVRVHATLGASAAGLAHGTPVLTRVAP